MPRFFGPRKLADRESDSNLASASASAHEMLLQRSTDGVPHDRRRKLQKGPRDQREPSQHALQRIWLAAADARRPAWSGERPAARKLAKDPTGSARPTFSIAIVDQDGRQRGRDTTAEGIRRTVARWREATGV